MRFTIVDWTLLLTAGFALAACGAGSEGDAPGAQAAQGETVSASEPQSSTDQNSANQNALAQNDTSQGDAMPGGHPRIDGHPDFTGVWTTYRGGGGPGAFNRDGGAQAQLTEMAQQKVDAYRAVTQGTNNSPGAYCVGSGMPASMLGSGGYPMEIVEHPSQINITYEAHKEIRRVYIGDHGYNPDDIFPQRNGFSVGHWEGDELVVETSRLEEQFDSRYPHSEEAKIVERYSLGMEDGKRVLTAEWTMTDPLYLKEPQSGEKKWAELEGGRLMNYNCTEPQWQDIMERLLAGEKVEYQSE
jgi:hypothetical protein